MKIRRFLVPGGLMIFIVLASASCRSVRYVTLDKEKLLTDTIIVEKEQVRHDSLIIQQLTSVERRDSVAPIIDSLNRVVGLEKWHFEKVSDFNNSERRILMSRIDSLRRIKEKIIEIDRPVEVEKIVEIERKRTMLENFILMSGLISIIVCGIRIFRKYA